jgi:hypothetical protein
VSAHQVVDYGYDIDEVDVLKSLGRLVDGMLNGA